MSTSSQRPSRNHPMAGRHWDLVAICAVTCLVLAALGAAGSQAVLAFGSDAKSRRGSPFLPPVELQSYAPLRSLINQERASEPVLEVNPSGAVFVAGASGVPTSSPVWRSLDGINFEELQTPGRAREYSLGAEGDLAVDDEGNVYFVETTLAGLLLTRWSDDGATWEYSIPVSAVGRVPTLYDRPWLAWADGTLYLYVNFGFEVQVFRSADAGVTWLQGSVLQWDNSTLNTPFFPGHLSAGPDGRVLVAGWVGGEDPQGIAAAYSMDGGLTFETRLLTPWPKRGGISPSFRG